MHLCAVEKSGRVLFGVKLSLLVLEADGIVARVWGVTKWVE